LEPKSKEDKGMNTQGASSTSRLPLPAEWVAKIFRELQGNYGTRFLNQWRSGLMTEDGKHDAGVLSAMGVWGRNLAGFTDRPEALFAVLAHLPPDPPTLPAFVTLCRDAAIRLGGNAPRLEHRMTPEEREKADEAAKAANQAIDRSGVDPLAWAKHPRSQTALDAVVKTAPAHKGLQRVFAKLIAEGVADEDGTLLRRYCGMERWETLRAARASSPAETEEIPA
jgi:hypothetical protein